MTMNRDRASGGPPRGGGGYRGGESPRSQTTLPDDKTLKEIVIEGNVETLVKWAETIGNGLARNERLTTSQVRGFFGTVRQIEAEVRPEQKEMPEPTYRKLILLKPKLTYQAARERESRKGEGVAQLERVLGPAISVIGKDPKRFHNFVEFFEAIVAYHKAEEIRVEREEQQRRRTHG